MSEDTEQIAIKVAGEFRLFCACEGITLPHHAEVRLKSLWATSIQSAIACERELNQKGGDAPCVPSSISGTDPDAPERSSHSGSVEHRCERCSGSGRNNLDGECIACDGTGFKGPKSDAHIIQSAPPVEAWRDLDEVRPTEADGDEHGRVLCRWGDEEVRVWPVTHFTKNEPTRVTHWAPLPKFGQRRVERKT